jgi:PST family polysaccharide transporter
MGGELGRLARRGVVWTMLTYLCGRAAGFLSLLVLARLLTPRDFGVAAAIAVFLMVLELAGDLGMKATVVYEQQEGVSERVQTAFTLNLVVSAALTAAAVLAAPAAASFLEVPEHADLFRLAALSLLLAGLGNVHDSLLLRGLEFGRRGVPLLIRAVTRGGVGIGLALAGLGAEALVLGQLAGYAAWVVALWVMMPFRPNLRLDRLIARSMIGYGAGAVAIQVLSAVAVRFDSAVIAKVLGAQALGLYTVAQRIPELAIESIAWNVSLVAFPALSRRRALDERGLGPATLTIFRYQALYALPAAAGLAMLGPALISIFGSSWSNAGPVLSAVAVTTGVSAAIFPLGDAFKAAGRQPLYITLMLLQFPLLLGGILLAAPHGIAVVAWTRAGMGVLHSTLVAVLVTRVVPVRVRDVALAAGPALAAALGVGLAVAATRLGMPGDGVAATIAATGAGALGGTATLRLLAPGAFRELRAALPRLRPSPAHARV